MELLENTLGGAAGSTANGFGAACQVFTWHSVGCTMPFAILFLSRNTAKVSEVAASFGHCSMIHWISHCSG